MSWISLILFPALLYCHLLNVELRHNVDGVPRQLCTLPTTPRFTCPHFPSLAFVPFPSASSHDISGFRGVDVELRFIFLYEGMQRPFFDHDISGFIWFYLVFFFWSFSLWSTSA